jgi:hypothetical protein
VKAASNVVLLQHAEDATLSGYRWRDKDPDMDFIMQAIQDAPMTTQQIATASGVSYSTLTAWAFGKVRKPQNVTVNAVMRAIGWHRPWTRDRGDA